MRPAHLKRSKAEVKERDKATSPSSGSDYGWGLSISLDHDHLKKMGIKAMPAAGGAVTIQGHAKVTRAEESDEGQGPRRSMQLQITHMAMAPKAGGKVAKVSVAPAKGGGAKGPIAVRKA